MRISELEDISYLGASGTGTNSYLIINYDTDPAPVADDTNPPVTYRVALDELGRAIASDLKLVTYDSSSGNMLNTIASNGETYDTPNVGQFATASDRTTINNIQTGYTDTNYPTTDPATSDWDKYYVKQVTNTNGTIAVTHAQFSPSLTLTDGTADNAPKIKTTVNGNESSDITLTKATTGVYGVTKLSNDINSDSEVLAATPKAVKDAIASLKKGQATGVAELDANGHVPSSQLPSYVDDVLEGTLATFPATGETGKIYVDTATNTSYRWSGSQYTKVASDLSLGETSSTAYRGDYGAAAYAAAVTNVTSSATSNSANLITSGGVYTELGNKADKTDTVLDTTLSMGRKSHTTVGTKSTALGNDVTASGSYSHAEGSETKATTTGSHAEGVGGSFTVGNVSYVSGASGDAGSHSEGYITVAAGKGAHSEGNCTRADGTGAHAEGDYTVTSANYAHAEGTNTEASGIASHAEGSSTIASGAKSHAEGEGGTYTLDETTYTGGAYGSCDHVEGLKCRTGTAGYAHAEGYQTSATGYAAHAEGLNTTAAGTISHAEGQATTTASSATFSHAEGNNTTVYGVMAHAEGEYTIAIGNRSHVEGGYTVAAGDYQHVIGIYNVVDNYSNRPEWQENTAYEIGDKVYVPNPSGRRDYGYTCKTAHTSDSTFDYTKWNSDIKMNYAEIIGNGTADDARSNARALTWEGDERLMGDLYIGCNADSTGGTKVISLPTPPTSDGTYTLQCSVTSGVVTYNWVSTT